MEVNYFEPRCNKKLIMVSINKLLEKLGQNNWKRTTMQYSNNIGPTKYATIK